MQSQLSIARAFLERLAGEPRTIMNRAGLAPYLSRYYLLGKPRRGPSRAGERPWDEKGNPYEDTVFTDGTISVHRFHESDSGWMHNHPWEWAVSLVLEHGYVEHRRGQAPRFVAPGEVNLLTHDDFHYVHLLPAPRETVTRVISGMTVTEPVPPKLLEATTLFITGPKTKSWGFWDELNGAVVPWREYLARERAGR